MPCKRETELREAVQRNLKVQKEQLLRADKTVHQAYTCDICDVGPIIGDRYHCIECPDYDLCEECEEVYGHDHALLRVTGAQDNTIVRALDWLPQHV